MSAQGCTAAQSANIAYAAGFPCLNSDSSQKISQYNMQECCTPTADYPNTCALYVTAGTVNTGQKELVCVNYPPTFGACVQDLAPNACTIVYKGSGSQLIYNDSVNCGGTATDPKDAITCHLADGSASAGTGTGSAVGTTARRNAKATLAVAALLSVALLASYF